MSIKHPIPPFALSAWIEGDQLFLALPSPAGGEHNLAIPLAKCSIETSDWGTPLARQLGWAALLSILRERSQLREAPAIATKGSLVQYDLEHILKTMSVTKLPPARKTEALPELSIEDLDL